jgi:guanylate kinase
MFTKIKDNSSYKRDNKTNAILNTDEQALAAYKAKKRKDKLLFLLEEKINKLEERLDRLEKKWQK